MSNEDLLKQAEEQRDAELRALDQVAGWEKAMQRTFRGILPRPVRRAMLDRAGDRARSDA